MHEQLKPSVAIVDYGMGNLFSVKQACEHAGLSAIITSRREDVFNADGVILPGVGAFGDAMETLRALDMVAALHEVVQRATTPLFGICLGMQLMMSESFEFGRHKGLDFFKGSVVKFERPQENGRVLKVPEVGWNAIYSVQGEGGSSWEGSLLRGLHDGTFMYLVHSFYCVPEDLTVRVSLSRYGHIEYCSSLQRGTLFACQFHPERSGPCGLQVYCQFAEMVYNKCSSDKIKKLTG